MCFERADWDQNGVCVFAPVPEVTAWVAAARPLAQAELDARREQPGQMRHGGTWFVGLDALPNAADGSVAGVALQGPWQDMVPTPATWHPAQVSGVFPGYPGRDAGDTDAGFRYRRDRGAAHLDGLLAEGPAKRRFLREPHGFILGLPLDGCRAAPLLVWPGSHQIMGDALRGAIGACDPGAVDLTDAYVAARREVFDTIAPVPVRADPGGAILLHRHLLHGIDIWRDAEAGGAKQRLIAYFRPLFPRLTDWL